MDQTKPQDQAFYGPQREQCSDTSFGRHDRLFVASINADHELLLTIITAN